ncbi:caspase-14-like [Narcine bancroftii]|uniref:caspase-14-like n=1 Tax=Narcine bancroftii TaxID=1343680 RepID=UPI00383190F0
MDGTAMDNVSAAVPTHAADGLSSPGARPVPSSQTDRYDMAGVRKACIVCVHKDREGSEEDLQNLKRLLHSLAFQVTEFIDPAGRNIVYLLKNYRDSIEAGTCCSLVFIMAHGKVGEIKGADNQSVDLEDIFDLFNNKNCTNLQLKPKVFVVQACRGEKRDYGVERLSGFRSMPEPEKVSTVSDTFIVYPSLKGYVAYRGKCIGSYMIRFIVDVLEESGEDEHLYDLFVKVNRKMVQGGYGNEKFKTTMVMESTLTKSLYLKPSSS